MLWVYLPDEAMYYGPYKETCLDNIKTFARIGSFYGGDRQVWKGRKKPSVLVRVYSEGVRLWPPMEAHAHKIALAYARKRRELLQAQRTYEEQVAATPRRRR